MLRGKGRALTRVSGFRGVSEGFRWFQRVSNANVGFKFQVSGGFRGFQTLTLVSSFRFQKVSGGFRRFQRVSNADAVSSFLVSGGKNKNVKDLKLFLTTNQTNLRIMV